jgi:hypothetical protein
MTIKQMKRKTRVKKFIKRNLTNILAIMAIIAISLFIAFNGSVCTGDYEGDINATCIRIIN